MLGHALIDGRPCLKPGTQISLDSEIALTAEKDPFVSRGGEKLKGALDALKLDVSGYDALDVGASTGGFTDCLLQRGASTVTAVDVGRAQLHPSLRSDPRVTVMEKCNFRHAAPADFPHPFHLVTIDVSFISLALILPVAAKMLRSDGRILALVKPQFEVGKGLVGKGGVVRDPALHRDAIMKAAQSGLDAALYPVSVVPSPLRGPKGNIEFFILFTTKPSDAGAESFASLADAAVRAAHSSQPI